jgi:hypothetical protein
LLRSRCYKQCLCKVSHDISSPNQARAPPFAVGGVRVWGGNLGERARVEAYGAVVIAAIGFAGAGAYFSWRRVRLGFVLALGALFFVGARVGA